VCWPRVSDQPSRLVVRPHAVDPQTKFPSWVTGLDVSDFA
jgi:hypothetical protein